MIGVVILAYVISIFFCNFELYNNLYLVHLVLGLVYFNKFIIDLIFVCPEMLNLICSLILNNV